MNTFSNIFHTTPTAHIKALSKALFSFLLVASFLVSCTTEETTDTTTGGALLLDDDTAAPGPNNPFLIQNEADLALLATFVNDNEMYSINNTDGSYRTAAYRLENDITLSGENNFTPIGTGDSTLVNDALVTTCNDICFEGTFDGANNTISGLHFSNTLLINNSATNVGLFAVISGSNTSISNLTLTGVNITGAISVGGLVGTMLNSSTISNVSATGSVTGNITVGGLIGQMLSTSSITGAAASVAVTGSGSISGGLVGLMNNSSMTNAFSSGAVSNTATAIAITGGLVGHMQSNSSITNAVASGAVSGQASPVGGLVGTLTSSSLINTLAWGTVSGGTPVGGLVGSGSDTITASYWDMTVNGTLTSDSTARDTTDLQTPESATDIYTNWNNLVSDIPVGAGEVWDFGGTTDYPAITGLLITVECQRDSADTSCPQ